MTMSNATGKIIAVNSNMLGVECDGAVAQNEVGYAEVADETTGKTHRLMSEIVRIRGKRADKAQDQGAVVTPGGAKCDGLCHILASQIQ